MQPGDDGEAGQAGEGGKEEGHGGNNSTDIRISKKNRTRMARILRIFTDKIQSYPCKSASSGLIRVLVS
jgi:hypothetical protein